MICVEEHTIDLNLLKAGQTKQQSEAANFREVGTSFPGKLEDGDDQRPITLDFRITAKLAADMGTGRIAERSAPAFCLGWHNEACVQLLRVLLSRKFDRFPNLQVIGGYWGEMVPFYLQRLDDMIPQDVSGCRARSQILSKNTFTSRRAAYESASL